MAPARPTGAVGKYRDARARAGVTVTTTSRVAALNGLRHREVSAVHPPELIRAVETVVDEAVRVCQDVGEREFGLTERIAVRHDWTTRTVEADSPRSRGGVHTNRFRALDVDDHDDAEHIGGRGASISLRLASEVSTTAPVALDRPRFWHEYTAIDCHPLIGGRNGITLADGLVFLVAHEAAHAIVIAGRRQPESASLLESAAREWVSTQLPAVGGRMASAMVRVSAKADSTWGAHEAAWQAVYYRLRGALGLTDTGTLREPSEARPATVRSCHLRPDLSSTTGFMSALLAGHACGSCGRELPTPTRRADGMPTRPQRYCSASCRARASRERAKA